MRYAKIEEYEVSNGHLGGQSLYVQGCRFRCPNCFNPETWDFNGGKEWTPEVEDKFIELASRPYIKRISLLGGECLADENLDGVLNLVDRIRLSFPEKTIWIYSGYTWEQIMYPVITDDLNPKRDEIIQKRKEIVSQCDILVDGRFVNELKDISLKWRGSSNQRVIDIQKSLQQNKLILYCD